VRQLEVRQARAKAIQPGARTLATYAGPIARTRRLRAADDVGLSLLGLIVTVGLLGVLAAVVLVATNKATTVPTLPTTSTTQGHGHTTTTVGIPVATLRATCVADYQAVTGAAQAYAVEHQGAMPPAGEAWATASAGGPLLQSWPSSPAFTMHWSGSVVVVQPWHHGRASVGSTGSSAPPSGCEAI
jgi:hypothetical protein